MSVAELKTELIQMAVETVEPNLLEQVIAYSKNLRQQADWWGRLSEQEKVFVEIHSGSNRSYR